MKPDWKWDREHVAILAAYLGGFGLAVIPSFVGHHFDATTLSGVLVLVAAALRGFFKSTPKDLGEAIADGEAEGTTDKAATK